MKEKALNACRKKFHFIYKTTCIITGREYFGMHSTNDIDDGYLGSGKILWYSIKKYGKENHVREIYGDFLPDRESLRLREAEIIDDHRLKDPKCMNIIKGGSAYDEKTMSKVSQSLIGRKLSKEHCEKISKLKKGQVPWNKGLTKENDARVKSFSKTLSRVNKGSIPWNKGSTKEEHPVIAKIAQKLSIVNKGKKLSDEHKLSIAGHVPWNKGLTKDTNQTIAKQAQKHSVLMTGKIQSEEHRRKNSEANKGRKVSLETRQKISETNKRTREAKRMVHTYKRGQENETQ